MKAISFDPQFLYLLSICLLTTIVLLLVFRKKLGDIIAGRFLLCYFASYLFLIGITYLFVYEDGKLFVHFFRTGHIASLLMPVFAYGYLKQNLYPQPKFRAIDLMHFLPALFFIVDMLPFFQLSGEEKWVLFSNMSAVEYRIGFSQGTWMPTYGHIIIRTLQMAIYWVLQFCLLRKANKIQSHPLRIDSPFTWKWLPIFLYTQAIFFVVPIAAAFFKDEEIQTVFYSIAATAAMAVQCFYLLLHPEVLHSDTFIAEKANYTEQIAEEQKEQSITEKRLSDSDILAIEPLISEVMRTQQPFTKQRYTLRHLSDDTGLSPYKLSNYINQEYGVHFNDYLNKFRVKEITKKINAGESAHKTLEAIAQECGFKSRTTFIRAFKKEKGMTPGEYLSTLQIN